MLKSRRNPLGSVIAGRLLSAWHCGTLPGGFRGEASIEA